MTPRHTFTTYGFAPSFLHQREDIATFFDLSDAITFAMHPERDGFEQRNVYVASGRKDKRKRGYRYEAPQVGQSFEDWCAEVDARKAERAQLEPEELPNGRFQVAA